MPRDQKHRESNRKEIEENKNRFHGTLGAADQMVSGDQKQRRGVCGHSRSWPSKSSTTDSR